MLAVAQIEASDALAGSPAPTGHSIRSAGERTRKAMAEAASAGTRMVQFPEGTLAYPSKRMISRSAPELDEADWSKLDWGALRSELEAVAETAGRLGIWTVVGAPHRLSGGRRPHNSLYVFSDTGKLVTRYDKRRLSTTEITWMYTPGTDDTVVEVDGYRLGFALCLEILFPEVFVDYAAIGVDAVLVSSAADPKFASLAQAHALMNMITVTLSMNTTPDTDCSSGVFAWNGCLASCDPTRSGIAICTVSRAGDLSFGHRARNGLYDGHYAESDPRSRDRQSL